MNKKTLTAGIGWLTLLLCFHGPAWGQTANNDTVGWGTLNYAVPESPAFKILGTSPSTIMRPSTTRSIAVSVGNYLVSNGATIPNNVAVAISPQIFNPKVTSANYRKNAWWYNSSLSIGTKQNTDKSYAVAFGYSAKLFDNADLRKNRFFAKVVDSIGPQLNENFVAFNLTESAKMCAIWDCAAEAAQIRIFAAMQDTTSADYKAIKPDLDQEQAKNDAALAQRIVSLRDSLKKTLWNATVMQIGVAGLWGAKDSLIKDLSGPPAWGAWVTLGLKLTKNGQLLLGVNGQNVFDSAALKMEKSFNAGIRWYLGSSDTKGYVQGEGRYMQQELPTYDAGIGIETTFFGGFWLDFSLGLKKMGHASWAFSPTLNFNFGNGEKNKTSSTKN